MNAFLEAARIWGEKLDSTVEITIDASFAPLSCTATSGTLGSAPYTTNKQVVDLMASKVTFPPTVTPF